MKIFGETRRSEEYKRKMKGGVIMLLIGVTRGFYFIELFEVNVLFVIIVFNIGRVRER